MSSSEIIKRQLEIVSEFSEIDDPMDRYEYIIDIGKKLPAMSEALKIDSNIVKGCQSTVWLKSFYNAGKIHFQADSNTVITKGIIALLIRVLNDLSPTDILTADLTFINDIGLRSHLSSQRSNGLDAMIQKMKTDTELLLNENKNMEQETVHSLASSATQVDSHSHNGNMQVTVLDAEQFRNLVIERLQTIFDPEIPVNIYDLGLIYDVQVYPPLNNVFVLMTVTSPNCPVADSLPSEVKRTLQNIANIGEVNVELTFEPSWTKDMMSEEARIELDMF